MKAVKLAPATTKCVNVQHNGIEGKGGVGRALAFMAMMSRAMLIIITPALTFQHYYLSRVAIGAVNK